MEIMQFVSRFKEPENLFLALKLAVYTLFYMTVGNDISRLRFYIHARFISFCAIFSYCWEMFRNPSHDLFQQLTFHVSVLFVSKCIVFVIRNQKYLGKL